jgi:hypothetical protein
MKSQSKFEREEVKLFYDLCDNKFKTKLLFLRNLIFDVAKQIDAIEKLDETLKWGEPSYAPSKANIGSPIRINRIKHSDKYALFVNCQSNLISFFKQIYPKTFHYGGNRSIIFDLNETVPTKELKHCISLALTYHLNKKKITPIG